MVDKVRVKENGRLWGSLKRWAERDEDLTTAQHS